MLSAVLLLCAAAQAGAQETTIQNDSTIAGTPSTPLNSFIAGEEAAAWLTSTCNGTLVAAQVYWASAFGGGPPSTETAIRVYDGSTHPTPGATLATVSLPTLSEATMNEFRFLDPPANSTPLSVPVTSGQTLTISLEHLLGNSGNAFAGAVVHDAGPCQSGRNGVKAIPGGWIDGCTTGIPGDLIIRAVIDCVEPVPLAPGWTRYGIGIGLLVLSAAVAAGRRGVSG